MDNIKAFQWFRIQMVENFSIETFTFSLLFEQICETDLYL